MLEQKQHRVSFIRAILYNVYFDTITANDINVQYAGYNMALANNCTLCYHP